MKDKEFILATDLDGTFLGGTEADRIKLYNWIEARRDTIGLVFVSGRDMDFIHGLCSETAVPWPDFVVGDVGTTIAEVSRPDQEGQPFRIRPLPDLEAEVAELWGDAGDDIRKLLASAPGLRLQNTEFRYRVSYHYDPETYRPEVATRVREKGFDILISDNRYFDVLPRGVSKGPSLKRLLSSLGAKTDSVLVAGDTMNDLSLFETGLKGVAVGNSEAPLLSRISDWPNVFVASRDGCAGIFEAIEKSDWYKK